MVKGDILKGDGEWTGPTVREARAAVRAGERETGNAAGARSGACTSISPSIQSRTQHVAHPWQARLRRTSHRR